MALQDERRPVERLALSVTGSRSRSVGACAQAIVVSACRPAGCRAGGVSALRQCKKFFSRRANALTFFRHRRL